MGRLGVALRLVKRAVSTAMLTLVGGLVGFLTYGALSGYAPQLAAQAPISVSPGGVDALAWTVVTGSASLLVWLLKAWVDRTSAQLDAQRAVSAALSERMARMEGQHDKGEG